MKEVQQRRRDGKVVTFYDFEEDEGDDLPEIKVRDNVVPFMEKKKP